MYHSLIRLVRPTTRNLQPANNVLKSQHRRPKTQRVPFPDHNILTLLHPQDHLDVGRDQPQRLVLAKPGVFGRPRCLQSEGLDTRVTRRSWGN